MGLGGGLIASLCWFGPALAVLLGLSGASFLFGALDNAYYYALGAFFLVVGLYYLLRQPAAVSLKARRRNRWFFPLVLVGSAAAAYLALTFVMSPLLVSMARAPAASSRPIDRVSSPGATASEQAAYLRQVELRVEGMTWETWATEVEEVARAQPGVMHIEFHWPEKTGVLVYDGNQPSAEQVVKHIEETKKRKLTIVADRAFP